MRDGGFVGGPETAPVDLATEGQPEATSAAPVIPERGLFARRVAGVFSTQIGLFLIAFVSSILLARILGPDGKGIYAAVVTLPAMLSAFGTLGLPSAANYFSGKGMSLPSLTRASYVLTVALSAVLVGVVWLILPALESSILSAARGYDTLLRVIVIVVPLSILCGFGGAILYGRQAVRVYNLIQLLMAAFGLCWVIVVVGLLRFGVNGAVVGSAVTTLLMTVLVMIALHRLARSTPGGSPVSYRGLASYGARAYPASLSGYFSYRADTYILQATVAHPTRPLGLYNQAVTMDELVFYIPNSIATLFLPRVAGATPQDSARMVARVGRLTTLLTIGACAALIPAAYVLIYLVLPRFVDCLPAFLVLLPGVVALSIGKVMTSYVAGRGRPGLVALWTSAALVLNVVLNIILIPMLGIVGAALSSVVSYTMQAVAALYYASRLSGNSPLALMVPGRAEVQLVIATVPRLVRGVPLVRRLVPPADRPPR